MNGRYSLSINPPPPAIEIANGKDSVVMIPFRMTSPALCQGDVVWLGKDSSKHLWMTDERFDS